MKVLIQQRDKRRHYLASSTEDGAEIFYGSTVPANSLGKDGDLYIRDDGTLYKKTSGAWVDTGIDLTGPSNARVYSLGTVAKDATPSVPSGAINGSIGVADDGRFWELVSGAWVYRGDLTGPQGNDGRPATSYTLKRKYRTSIATLGTDGVRFTSTGRMQIKHGDDEPFLQSLPVGSYVWVQDGTKIRSYKIRAS